MVNRFMNCVKHTRTHTHIQQRQTNRQIQKKQQKRRKNSIDAFAKLCTGHTNTPHIGKTLGFTNIIKNLTKQKQK